MTIDLTPLSIRQTVLELASNINVVIESLQDEIEYIKSEKKNGTIEAMLPINDYHPLSEAWIELLDGIAKSEQEGTFQLSNQALHLIGDLYDINNCKEDPLFAKKIEKLKHKNEYHSVIYEFRCYTFCKRNDASPVFILESAVKTPDIKLRLADSVFFIECKGLEHRFSRERVTIYRIFRKINEFAKKKNYSVDLTIIGSKEVHERDVSKAVGMLTSAIRRLNLIKVLNLDIGRAIIRRAIAWSVEKGIKIQHNEQNFEIIHLEVTGVGGKHFLDWVCALKFRPYKTFNFSQSIIKMIKKSRTKFSSENHNIVYVQLPYDNHQFLYRTIDESYDGISKYFQSSGSRIIAVILIGRVFNKNVTKDSEVFQDEYYVIPNHFCPIVVPSHVAIPGTFKPCSDAEVSVRDIDLTKEGTIISNFTISERDIDKFGSYLFRYISNNGARQLHVRVFNRKEVLIELIHEEFGRLKVVKRVFDLCPDRKYGLGITWNLNREISLALTDGEQTAIF